MPGLSWIYGTFLIARNKAVQSRLIRTMGSRTTIRYRDCIFEFDFESPHDSQVFDSIRKAGGYEPETTAALLTHLKPGDLFVDVGASSGYYAILAARQVGETGQVVAIEASATPFKRMLHNIHLNGFDYRIRAICAAASDHDGQTLLFINPWDDGWTSTKQRTRIAVKVSTLALDEVATPRRRATVKIDVEGAELEVLRGMRGLMNAVTEFTLVVEWNRKYVSQELRRFLFDNFTVDRIIGTATGSYLIPISETEIKRGITVCNLWCQKKRGASFLKNE